MIKRTLKQVQEMVNGTGLDTALESVMINGVTINSREIQEGNLFIPIKGERFNGHDFVEGAMKNGAAATFWQKSEGEAPANIPVIYVEDTMVALQELAKQYRQQLSLKIVGITGSNGKTSTKDILASILSTKFSVHKTAGNYNNHLGLPLTLLQIDEDIDVAVLEMGMSGLGEIEFLTTLAQPDAAIITNIGEAHIQELGSRENISIAKMEIVLGLKDDGLFVYHGDEPLLIEKVAKLNAPYKLMTFGDEEPNDYYPTSMETVDGGTIFTIPQTDVKFMLPVLGKHNVYNTLAAIAVARNLGVTFEQIKAGLQTLQMTKMRMETIKMTSGITVINDAYNANPASMKAGLDLIHSLTDFDKKIVVLGDMLELGDNEVAYHEEVGAYIDPNEIDIVYTYGALGKHIANGAKQCKDVRAFDVKQELIEDLKKNIAPVDVIYVKASRGMKMEEVVFALTQE